MIKNNNIMKSIESFRKNEKSKLQLSKTYGGALYLRTKRRSTSKDVSGNTVDKCWHED